MGTHDGLLEHTFRASSNFQLVPFHGLGDDDKGVLGDLTRDPEFFGLLEPRVRGLGVKSASRTTAALLRALSKPGPLPTRVRASARGDTRGQTSAEILCLVLDGVLDVEHEGRFVSGAAASHLLGVSPTTSLGEGHDLATLAREALRYGEALSLHDAQQLSARLYFYNRRPVTPAWAHRLASRSAVLDFIGGTRGETRNALERYWALLPADAPGAWISWKPREPNGRHDRNTPTYKLYVSPAVQEMPHVFETVVRELAGSAPMPFKIGGDAAGLARPDKMVLYFASHEALERVAHLLSLALDGVPAHGVPFTSAVGSGCLLSEGMDPPRSMKLLSWRDAESWRLWVTNRLAVYMLAAGATRGKPAPSSRRAATRASVAMSASEFALARLRLDGVDTDTWAPHAALWNAAAPAAH